MAPAEGAEEEGAGAPQAPAPAAAAPPQAQQPDITFKDLDGVWIDNLIMQSSNVAFDVDDDDEAATGEQPPKAQKIGAGLSRAAIQAALEDALQRAAAKRARVHSPDRSDL